MNADLERKLLLQEVALLARSLFESGMGVFDTSPNQDGTFEHLSTDDLRTLKRDLRDLSRTLGGASQR